MTLTLPFLFLASLWAGAQNALAGGGSFLTLPALILTGLDARAANIASTIALFPGQSVAGYAGRNLVGDTPQLRFRWLFVISLAGGVVGAYLLLATPASVFDRMVPWLVLVGTGIFAWGSFRKRPLNVVPHLGAWPTGILQFLIAIYGGYFGGGVGFLMIAMMTIAGMGVRTSTATKNALSAVMNASAVLVFCFSSGLPWLSIGVVALGAIIGALGGVWALRRVPETLLRLVIVGVGLCLTVGLFWRQFG